MDRGDAVSTYPAIQTDIEPPLPEEDDGDGEPRVGVYVSLIEADDTRRCALTHLPADAPDDHLADALVRALIGTATMRSPGLMAAVRARMQAELTVVPNSTGAGDRIGYDPDGQTVDEIVMRNVAMVHIETLDFDRAYFHLTDRHGRQVRGHLTARKLTPAERRAMRQLTPDQTPPTAALLITVDDDEIGLGQ